MAAISTIKITVTQLIGCCRILKFTTSMIHAAARFCCTIRVTIPIAVNPIATINTTVIQLAGVQEMTDSPSTAYLSVAWYQGTSTVSSKKEPKALLKPSAPRSVAKAPHGSAVVLEHSPVHRKGRA